jgi:hypothetical protein
MRAVLRAVLLDPEARDPNVAEQRQLGQAARAHGAIRQLDARL